MGYLTRDQILGADDHRYEDVTVPEWGGTLRIRTLTAEEHEQFVEWSGALEGGEGARSAIRRKVRSRLVFLTAVDDAGKRLFESEEDVDLLQAKSSTVMLRVCKAIMELNGMGQEAVETIEGESGADQGADSPSA